MRKDVALVMLSLSLTGCGSIFDFTVDRVNLRVLNNSDYDFKNVTVNSVYMGDIKKYHASDYKEFEMAYHYGAVQFEVNDKKFRWQPIDYVGETPLPKGKYTYMISIDYETNGTHLKFFEGDDFPKGPQAPGRSRIVNIEHHYEAWSGKQTTDGGYIISGDKRTVTTTNPTVSTIPGSRVIYLPEAYTFGFTTQAFLLKTNAEGHKEWSRTYGKADEGSKNAEEVALTNDGGYIFSGHHESSDTRQDGTPFWRINAWLVKTDGQGNELSSKTFGGTDFTRGHAIDKTTDGGFVVAGERELSAYLLKVDVNGNEMWSRNFANSSHAESVQSTADGGYILAGDRFGSFSDGSDVIKTDASGNQIWKYHSNGSAFAIRETADAGYIVAGYQGRISGFLLKLDRLGNRQWEKMYGAEGKSFAYAVLPATDGGFIVGGFTGTAATMGYDYWLFKTDAAGVPTWERSYGKAAGLDMDDKAYDVLQTHDGGYLLIGTAGRSQIWLVKTNADGTKQWDRILND